jgi:hypothetical protein
VTQNIVYVKDGDNLNVIAKLDPSASDPAGLYPGVGQTFRVVANSFGPALKLVPLSDRPSVLSELRQE